VNPSADAQPVSDLKAFIKAERSGRPFLLFYGGDGKQQVVFLDPGSGALVVGRDPSAGFVLDWDSQVSRRHARLEPDADGWAVVEDAPSRNGTFVNGSRVTGRRRLTDGDAIRFATTEVAFHSPTPERRESGESRVPPGVPVEPTAPAPAPPVEPVPPAPSVALSSTQYRVLVSLCRPYKGRSGFASPATDEQIAEDLILSISEVRGHLKVLAAKLGLGEPPLGEARVRLVERAFDGGLVSERDL
jgi:pSer/pThr/pTyr-binding forkhead associated (FHA) protein